MNKINLHPRWFATTSKKYLFLATSLFSFMHARVPTELLEIELETDSGLPTELQEANKKERESASKQNRPYFGNLAQPKKAEWTFIIYMEADNDLANMAIHNIMQMKSVDNSDRVNIIVQWDKPSTKMTHRLKIEKGREIDVGSLPQEMGINPAKEIIECMHWVSTVFPAEHYGIILWNHGGGIIDEPTKHCNWLTPEGSHEQEVVCRQDHIVIPVRPDADKGILYADQRNYLSNQDLYKVMAECRAILGQKVDFLGMDACLMSMVEIADGLHESVQWMVASANLEQGEGWAYDRWLSKVVKAQGQLSAYEVGQAIVDAYESYYINRDPRFTQAITNVHLAGLIKDQLNLMVIQMLEMHYLNPDITNKIMGFAYQQTAKYMDNNYADIKDLSSKLSHVLGQYISVYIRNEQAFCKSYVKVMVKLERILIKIRELINAAVPYNAAGRGLRGTGGLSIYCPPGKMDKNYASCAFAQSSLWPKLLTLNEAARNYMTEHYPVLFAKSGDNQTQAESEDFPEELIEPKQSEATESNSQEQISNQEQIAV